MEQGRSSAMEFPRVYSGGIESPKAGNKEDEGERFGVILSRSRSVSFASSTVIALKAEKQNSALENAMKRAFSMRRSSSVSRGYYKIFHHCDPDNATKSRKKRSKIFEACRRLIGFY
ncbi:hypothetical protein PTKIN_Ptkin09bG0081000 [Pterospermum kingtungense]